MILEIADIRIPPGKNAEFDAAIHAGSRPCCRRPRASRGYKVQQGHRVARALPADDLWDTLENHTVDFRQGPLFAAWRAHHRAVPRGAAAGRALRARARVGPTRWRLARRYERRAEANAETVLRRRLSASYSPRSGAWRRADETMDTANGDGSLRTRERGLRRARRARAPPARARRRGAPGRDRPGVEPRRRGPGAHRPDRARPPADRRRHARHRQAARRDARADRASASATASSSSATARCTRRWSPSSAATARTRCDRSVELRKAAARIRKIEPLGRALAGQRGLDHRACAASSRTTAPTVAVRATSTTHGRAKFNPLADWTWGDVWHYLARNDVPYNALHDRVLPEHRLRAVHARGQPGRGLPRRPLVVGAGGAKECGLHVGPRHERDAGAPRMNAPTPTSTAARARARAPATSTRSRKRRSSSCARSRPRSSARRCCSPAARTRCVLLHLAREGVPRRAASPFPLLHIDTGHNFPSDRVPRLRAPPSSASELDRALRRGLDRARHACACASPASRATRTSR